jgi:hypothetical protein
MFNVIVTAATENLILSKEMSRDIAFRIIVKTRKAITQPTFTDEAIVICCAAGFKPLRERQDWYRKIG